MNSKIKLKFEGIPVGYEIRAYDFEPRHDRPNRYIEGVIVSLYDEDFMGYEVLVTHDTLCEVPRTTVIVPMEISFLDYDNRIEVIK